MPIIDRKEATFVMTVDHSMKLQTCSSPGNSGCVRKTGFFNPSLLAQKSCANTFTRSVRSPVGARHTSAYTCRAQLLISR